MFADFFLRSSILALRNLINEPNVSLTERIFFVVSLWFHFHRREFRGTALMAILLSLSFDRFSLWSKNSFFISLSSLHQKSVHLLGISFGNNKLITFQTTLNEKNVNYRQITYHLCKLYYLSYFFWFRLTHDVKNWHNQSVAFFLMKLFLFLSRVLLQFVS